MQVALWPFAPAPNPANSTETPKRVSGATLVEEVKRRARTAAFRPIELETSLTAEVDIGLEPIGERREAVHVRQPHCTAYGFARAASELAVQHPQWLLQAQRAGLALLHRLLNAFHGPVGLVLQDKAGQADRLLNADTAVAVIPSGALEQLAGAGKPGMVVWPVHCVTGTWGHNIHSDVARSLAAWELAHQRAVTKVLKGEYPLSEHFGVFEADAPVPSVPGTQFNTALASSLVQAADVIAIAGEASSHCVAASYDQFMRYLASAAAPAPRVVLLQDAMSPVTGFEPLAAALFERARAAGTQVMTVDAFASSLQ